VQDAQLTKQYDLSSDVITKSIIQLLKDDRIESTMVNREREEMEQITITLNNQSPPLISQYKRSALS
jgi:hypothetical protein